MTLQASLKSRDSLGLPAVGCLLAMNRRPPAVIIATLWVSGCDCHERIFARAFLGHRTEEDCQRLKDLPEQPVSLACPGSEITICWKSNLDKMKIDLSPDADGLSADTYPGHGVLYLRPLDNTIVKLSGKCASTAKQVQVIGDPTPAEFDAAWDDKCQTLAYSLDPNFVDPHVKVREVTAYWDPIVQSEGHWMTCPTPPFLTGVRLNPPAIFGFPIDRPFVPKTFVSDVSAVGTWAYELKACDGLGFTCDRNAAEPFSMTLVCPSQ